PPTPPSTLFPYTTLFRSSYEQVAPFTQLNYDISSILHFRCIKFRFGRISLEYFEKFQSFVYDAVDTILFKCREDEEYVWLVFKQDRKSTRLNSSHVSISY